MCPEPHPPAPTREPDPDTLFCVPGTASHCAEEAEQWALIRYVGHPLGEFILLGAEGLRLGRSTDNGLCLADPEVSRHHAQVSWENGRLGLQDLGSTNGTFVNGQRLGTQVEPLNHGDVLRVGGHAFKLKRLDLLERTYHERMLAQSTLDSLTGVSNRAMVLGFLEKQADLARRHGRPLSLILCDLDHFKEVNDRYGHPTGDRALQSLGVNLLSRLRSSDHIGRIGGEEFLIVLPETTGAEAAKVAEELRRSLAADSIAFSADQPPLQFTASFGVAQFKERDTNGGSLLARADVALYRAKAQGRNRVIYDEMA